MTLLRLGLLLMLAGLAAACDTLTVPTASPTRQISGPTLQPTDGFVIPRPPSEVPSDADAPIGANNPTAAALPNDLDLPPLALPGSAGTRAVQITLNEYVLQGDLFAAVPVRAPGVLLLSTDRTRWGDFPAVLEENGYVALSVTLPPGFTADNFRQLLASFSEFAQGVDSRLDPSRLAVIGELAGADVALRGCTVDPRCDALGLLTPTDATGTAVLAAQYGSRPLLVSASQDDTARYTLAQNIAAAAPGETLLQPFESAGGGADMLLTRPDFAGLILAWLDQSLAP